MSLVKRQPYRNNKILASAKGQPCTWPGCSTCDGTVVFAHSNMSIHGKSTGRKADDLFGAHLCHTHHHYYDNEPENMMHGQKECYFMRAMSETLLRLLDAGILK